jgi:hypothetical protein
VAAWLCVVRSGWLRVRGDGVAGSGLGVSSILAGTVLAAVGEGLGRRGGSARNGGSGGARNIILLESSIIVLILVAPFYQDRGVSSILAGTVLAAVGEGSGRTGDVGA